MNNLMTTKIFVFYNLSLFLMIHYTLYYLKYIFVIAYVENIQKNILNNEGKLILLIHVVF